MQRLEDEYDAQVLITTPSVPYKLKLTENSPTAKLHGKDEIEMTNPSKWPAVNEVKAYYEPVVKATIICPVDYQPFEERNFKLFSMQLLLCLVFCIEFFFVLSLFHKLLEDFVKGEEGSLTLFVAGLEIYINWWGGFPPPPMFS